MGRFVLDATPEEEAFGFRVIERPDGGKALSVVLAPGVRVVKVRAIAGAIEYAVCDEDLRTLYIGATTLDELRRRFAR